MTPQMEIMKLKKSHSFLKYPSFWLSNLNLVKHRKPFIFHWFTHRPGPCLLQSTPTLIPVLFLLHLYHFFRSSYSSALKKDAGSSSSTGYSPSELYSITSQKTAVLALTAVTMKSCILLSKYKTWLQYRILIYPSFQQVTNDCSQEYHIFI